MAGSPENKNPHALAAAAVDDVAARIVGEIRAFRPQVVITHDPRGGYGHPDHIAMHRATLRAFHLAAESEYRPQAGLPHAAQKLYYHVFRRGWLRRLLWILPIFGTNPRRFGRNADIDLTEIISVEYPAHAQVDIRPFLSIKEAAGRCHASQQAPTFRGPLAWILRPAAGWENYFRAHPAAPLGMRELDLFDGIVLSGG